MRTFLPALAVGALTAGAAHAQEGGAAVKSAVVAVIDLQKVTNESLLGKELASKIQALQDEIEAERTKKQSELQQKQAAIQTLREEINKQRSVLSQEAIDAKLAEVRNREREAQAFVEDGQRELQRMEERATGQAQQAQEEYRDALKPHIDAVAVARGVDILVDASVTLFVKPDFDISQDVIVRADEAKRAAGGGASQP